MEPSGSGECRQAVGSGACSGEGTLDLLPRLLLVVPKRPFQVHPFLASLSGTLDCSRLVQSLGAGLQCAEERKPW